MLARKSGIESRMVGMPRVWQIRFMGADGWRRIERSTAGWCGCLACGEDDTPFRHFFAAGKRTLPDCIFHLRMRTGYTPSIYFQRLPYCAKPHPSMRHTISAVCSDCISTRDLPASGTAVSTGPRRVCVSASLIVGCVSTAEKSGQDSTHARSCLLNQNWLRRKTSQKQCEN